jgi:uncharacterized protein (DUF2147 family)
MKRFCTLLALMALSSSAHADSYSFVVAGHYIHIEAPRHCRSASCVSLSIPGRLRSKGSRDRDDEVATAPQPQPAPAKIVVLPPPLPSSSPPPAAASAPPIVAPPPPRIEPVKTTQAEPLPSLVPKPASVTLPVPIPVPARESAEVSQESADERADTPLGDWQTEGNKGTVRIERCGQAMCGYLLNASSNAKNDVKNEVERDGKGDAILINMKPKSDTIWSGNIYSRSSGRTYYATMTMKGADTLRVEACGLGRFFCSGNDWTRIENDSTLLTYRQTSQPPS